MKTNSFILFLILIHTSMVYSQKRIDLNFNFDGHDRECIIVIPGHSPPADGYPIVFMLHGTSGDGEKFYNISGWKELGEKENFITVFPSSLSWCWVEDGVEKRNTRWVCGNVTEFPCAVPQNYVDDVRFLKKIASVITDSLPVNRKKIFASGFSNGSCMVHKLAMEAGDLFSSVAGTGGPLALSDSTTPIKRIPTWFMVCTLDDRFIRPPFTELPYGRDSILTYLGRITNAMLRCQGLSNNFIFHETPNSHTYMFTESEAGMNAAPYFFTLLKNLEHVYPNGSNYPLEVAPVFWDFFNNSPVVAVDENKIGDQWLTAYPNPSNEMILLTLNPSSNLQIRSLRVLNALGQIVKVLHTETATEFILRKTELGTGMFFIHAQSLNHYYTKKIVLN
jgi:polyhydroxybutyrate depolymerase